MAEELDQKQDQKPEKELEKELDKEYGKLLRAARKKAGLTQEMLGRLTGTPTATISRYETGKSHPGSYERYVCLADAVGCDVEDMVPSERLRDLRIRAESRLAMRVAVSNLKALFNFAHGGAYSDDEYEEDAEYREETDW